MQDKTIIFIFTMQSAKYKVKDLIIVVYYNGIEITEYLIKKQDTIIGRKNLNVRHSDYFLSPNHSK